MSWQPVTDFENEILSLQPGHDFIFGSLADPEPEVFFPRPERHYLSVLDVRQREGVGKKAHPGVNKKLEIISKIQKIAKTKPLGELPTIADWDNDEDVERETVAMMRHIGLCRSIDEPLREDLTIATLPIAEDMLVMHNGSKRMPIFFDEKYFKLRPLVSPSLLDGNSSESLDAPEVNRVPTTHDSANTSRSSGSDELESRSRTDNSSTSSAFETASTLDSADVDSYSTAQTTRSCNRSDVKYEKSDDSFRNFQRFYTAKELYYKRHK